MGMSYAFVDFLDRATAERVLSTLNNAPHGAGSSGTFRLNWATHSAGSRLSGMPPSVEYSMYVGDLGPSVSDAALAAAFNNYRSVKSARVVMDHNTGMSKGFGFVKFTSEEELNRALVEMQVRVTVFDVRVVCVFLFLTKYGQGPIDRRADGTRVTCTAT